MTDYLHPAMEDAALTRMSSLALAHMGDCVYEMMTRAHLTCSGLTTNRTLHRETVRIVCAASQAAGAHAILPLLSEEERAVLLRGRNAKPHHMPKGASVADYSYATALEALFGWLYLRQEYDRLNELFAVILEAIRA
ncbi:MAG: Mini-ribonuclease 3 [Butyricicoccaceae bacterium]